MPRLGADKQKATANRTRAEPRAPLRVRGMARYAAILDAAEELLRDVSPDDVGLYQIASAADVPPASVYHFFPTKEAVFVALAKRYIDGFHATAVLPIEAVRLKSWQDLIAIDQERARDYYSSHPAALKLLYGGFGGIESRRIDTEYVSLVANVTYDRFDSIFHMPYVSQPAHHFHISWAIVDAIWSLSFIKQGGITDEYAKEALAACVSYCRLFLPDRVEVREHVRLAAEKVGACVNARVAVISHPLRR